MLEFSAGWNSERYFVTQLSQTVTGCNDLRPSLTRSLTDAGNDRTRSHPVSPA